jgi:WD40 repeat protein
MRILPRSARGTWLLAAVWLGLCWLAWIVMPVQPRGVWTVPAREKLIKDAINSLLDRGVIILTGPGQKKTLSGLSFPLHLSTTPDGSARTLSCPEDCYATYCVSPDGRWLVAREYLREITHTRAELFDLTSGTEIGLSKMLGDDSIDFRQALFSPDGKWLALAYVAKCDEHYVQIWDVAGRRPAAILPAAFDPMAFSTDGRHLATNAWAPQKAASYFAVWDVATGREMSRANNPLGFALRSLTSDGKALILSLDENIRVYNKWPHEEFICQNIADGRVRWSVSDVEFYRRVHKDGRLVMYRTNRKNAVSEAVVLDIESGQVQSRITLADLAVFRDIAPDGESVLIGRRVTSRFAVFRAWLARHGLMGFVLEDFEEVLIDTATGRQLHSFPVNSAKYGTDGQSLMQFGSDGEITQWDIPPRKPLTWFALAAAILALPVAGLAWRRSRRLRREAA